MKAISILLVVLWLLPHRVHAQSGDISGKVYDNQHEGANKARIDIVDDQGQPTGRFVISDVDGNFTIKPLLAGKYNIQVSCKGFQSVLNTDIVVNADKSTFLNFNLKPSTNGPANNKKKKKAGDEKHR